MCFYVDQPNLFLKAKWIKIIFVIRLVFLVLCLICCTSCQQKKQPKKFEIKKINLESKKAKKDSTAEKIDSFFSIAIEKALMLAKTTDERSFKKNFSLGSDDLNNKIDVEVRSGYLFSKNYRNLLIVSSSNGYTKINIYLIETYNLKQLVNKTLMTGSYPDWSIKDINSDGLKDFLVNWYPMSGCCMRNIFDLYLSQTDKTFSPEIALINPTFFSKEKLIRGVTYDHPGLASLYKFKWNGLKLDTLEYVYPNINDTIQISFVKSKKISYPRTKNNPSKNIKSIPNEYKTVLGLDYFKSYDLKDIKIILKNYDN